MSSNNDFKSLGVADFLIEKLNRLNIKEPTDVQVEAIPFALQGRDVIGQSPTGTGKTLAYLLPVLSRLDKESKSIQALVLAPTRELAMQITNVAKELAEEAGITTVALLGGADIKRQIDNLKKKPQLIVGTPGRILELIRMRKVNSQTMRTLVLDEVDKMWKLGFKEDIMAIIKTTLKDRQILMFSATISPEVATQTMAILNKPEGVNLSSEGLVAGTIEHLYFTTLEKNKAIFLKRLIGIYKPKKAIVFLNSNKGVMPFVKRFNQFGFAADGLFSELTEQDRKAVLDRFRLGKVKLLVTTDLFARGMDVEDVEIVFNFDLPQSEEYYIHRVGRTGRSGKKGLAISFATPDQKFIMAKYQKGLQIRLEEYAATETKVFSLKAGKEGVTREENFVKKEDNKRPEDFVKNEDIKRPVDFVKKEDYKKQEGVAKEESFKIIKGFIKKEDFKSKEGLTKKDDVRKKTFGNKEGQGSNKSKTR
jgi:ATP-dependent RNA helicase DeaD